MSSHQPSILDKLQMGLLMGGTVGATMGLVMGTVTVLVYGPGPNGYLRTIGANMLKTGGFFASIMSIGSLIRTEGEFKQLALEKPQSKRDLLLPVEVTSLQRRNQLQTLFRADRIKAYPRT